MRPAGLPATRCTPMAARGCDLWLKELPVRWRKNLRRVREHQSAVSETRKIAAILFADVVGYSRLAGADEERTLCAAPGLAQRPDRPRRRRASRARRQAHRRRQPHRVPQRGRRGALRDRGAERPRRAQRGRAARAPHRIPHRRPSGRRGRGGRWRSDGRRRQYRRAA